MLRPMELRDSVQLFWFRMKRLVSLQMISLLIFNDHMSAAAARASRCVSAEQVIRSVGRFQKKLGPQLRAPTNLQPDARTCAQTAAEMSGDLSTRSLSPWKYRLDRKDNRIPHEISFAECLCRGCIINRREDARYNSVPVFVPLMVLRKTPCPRDPNKFLVHNEVVNVPVGCTCAVPKYAE